MPDILGRSGTVKFALVELWPTRFVNNSYSREQHNVCRRWFTKDKPSYTWLSAPRRNIIIHAPSAYTAALHVRAHVYTGADYKQKPHPSGTLRGTPLI